MREASLKLQHGAAAHLLSLCSGRVCCSAGFSPALARAVFRKTHEDVVLLPLGFYSFYLRREGWRQSQRFGGGELRSSDKTRSSSDGCATQKVEPSHFPLAATGSVQDFLTGKLSPQTLRLHRLNSYHLHKQCRLHFAFSCIFLLQFFF